MAFTAFDGPRRLAAGSMAEVALAAKQAIEAGAGGPVLVFDDATGRVVDIDIRGAADEMVDRLSQLQPTPRGRGRPKLGVVAREVTLLPRHWDWLAAQQGGASAAIRRLVDVARREDGDATAQRRARDAAYAFMSAMAGDLPGFEEAARSLFAGDRERFGTHTRAWPRDVREHAAKLGFAAA